MTENATRESPPLCMICDRPATRQLDVAAGPWWDRDSLIYTHWFCDSCDPSHLPVLD